MTEQCLTLIWPIVITGLSPFFIWIFRKNVNLREGVSFAAAIVTFGSSSPSCPPC